MHWDLKNDAPISYLLPSDKMKQSEINDALSMLSCHFKNKALIWGLPQTDKMKRSKINDALSMLS